MAAQNEQRRQANADMIRQYAEGEYAAGRMTENGVRIINDFYDGSVLPSAYIQGMTAAYNAGAKGADVKSVDTSALTDLQRDAAYLAGQAAGRKELHRAHHK